MAVYVFRFNIDTAMHNALSNTCTMVKFPMTLLDFRLKLAEELLLGISCRKRKGRHQSVLSASVTQDKLPVHRKVKIKGRKLQCRHCLSLGDTTDQKRAASIALFTM